MFRKLIIVAPTLAAIGTALLWPMSCRVNERAIRTAAAKVEQAKVWDVYSDIYRNDGLGRWKKLQFGEDGSLGFFAQEGRLQAYWVITTPWLDGDLVSSEEPPALSVRLPGHRHPTNEFE